MMRPHKFMGKMESDAKALARITALHESAEELFSLLLRNAHSRVSHTDGHHIREREAYRDGSLGMGVLEGVGQKIEHHLIHFLLVKIHQIGWQLRLKLKIYLLRFSRIVKHLADALHEHHNIRFLQGKLQFSCLHLSEFQQLVDESQHTLHTLIHRSHGFLQLQLPMIRLHDALLLFERALNQCKRCAELMCNIGKEHQLIACKLLFELNFSLQDILFTNALDYHNYHHREEQGIEHPCPYRQIEWRLNADIEYTFLAPDTIGIRCLDVKATTAKWQILVINPRSRRRNTPRRIVSL